MGSLVVLSAAAERRDPYTLGHGARVTAVARAIASRLGCERVELEALALGGPLHDIGKLAVPADILSKPGRLDARELAQIREHPVAGARLLRGVRALRAALPCVLHHHERWDGKGYPHGLASSAIPRAVRILAVADAWDAMTTTRPYRGALPVGEALAEVARCAGSQFDPEPASALVAAWEAGEIALHAGAVVV